MLGHQIIKRVLHISLLLLVATVTGCHTFFTVNTVVTDASTGQPLSDATVTLVLDKGVEEPDVVKTTGTNGKVEIWINEPPSAWATLTVEKNGYETWSTQFRGSPCHEFAIRLKREKAKVTEQEN